MWGRGWAGLFLVHSEFGGWRRGSHLLGWVGSALQGRLFTPNSNPQSIFGAREGNSGESREENRIICGEITVLGLVGNRARIHLFWSCQTL